MCFVECELISLKILSKGLIFFKGYRCIYSRKSTRHLIVFIILRQIWRKQRFKSKDGAYVV